MRPMPLLLLAACIGDTGPEVTARLCSYVYVDPVRGEVWAPGITLYRDVTGHEWAVDDTGLVSLTLAEAVPWFDLWRLHFDQGVPEEDCVEEDEPPVPRWRLDYRLAPVSTDPVFDAS